MLDSETDLIQHDNKAFIRGCLSLIQEEISKIYPNIIHKNDGVVRIPPGNSYQANFEMRWTGTHTLLDGTKYHKRETAITGFMRLQNVPDFAFDTKVLSLVITLKTIYGEAPIISVPFDPQGLCFKSLAEKIAVYVKPDTQEQAHSGVLGGSASHTLGRSSETSYRRKKQLKR